MRPRALSLHLPGTGAQIRTCYGAKRQTEFRNSGEPTQRNSFADRSCGRFINARDRYHKLSVGKVAIKKSRFTAQPGAARIPSWALLQREHPGVRRAFVQMQ